MQQSKDIFYKVELIKKNNKSLGLNIHLNPDTINVIHNDSTITWTPTIEEEQFLLDALRLLDKQRSTNNITFSKKDKSLSIQPEETLHETIDIALEKKNNQRNINDKKYNNNRKYKDLEEIIGIH